MHQFSAHAIFAIVSAVGVALSKREFAFALFLYLVFVRIVIRLRLIKTSPNRYSRATWPKKKRTWPDAKSKTRTRTCNLDLVLGRLVKATRRVGVNVARTTQCLMPSGTFVLFLSATVLVVVVASSCCCWCCCCGGCCYECCFLCLFLRRLST